MSSDTSTAGAGQAPERNRNRRRFLAGAATGLATLGLWDLASADPAMAADGNNLILGSGNSASHVTALTLDGTVDIGAFEVVNSGSGTSGAGVVASSNGSGIFAAAIYGANAANGGGFGVYGFANPGGTGVLGQSTTGVRGVSVSPSGGAGAAGVVGDSNTNAGVAGFTSAANHAAGEFTHTAGGVGVVASSNGSGINAAAIVGENLSNGGFGVRGFANPGGTGVLGQSTVGVMGTSGTVLIPPAAISGTGVCGVAGDPSGGAGAAGVVGDSSTIAGVAGFTSAPNHAAGEFHHTAGGAALNVMGPAQFAQSGLVSIAAGKKSATVTGVALRAASLVLATAQNSVGVFVASAVPNVTGSAITISLNKAVPTGMTAKVAWFVVN